MTERRTTWRALRDRLNAKLAGPCHQTWPDPDSIRVHVCKVLGDHTTHICGACGLVQT